MSDPMAACAAEIDAVLARHLSALLADRCDDDWRLPAVAEWVLVMGVDDADGSGSLAATVQRPHVPWWRRLGLLEAAAADLRQDG